LIITAKRLLQHNRHIAAQSQCGRHRNMCEEGHRIAELEAEIDALQRQSLALSAEPIADVPARVLLGVKIDQCPHSAERDMRALNEGAGFDPSRTSARRAGAPYWAKRQPPDSERVEPFVDIASFFAAKCPQ
jgi:hypothetical protein